MDNKMDMEYIIVLVEPKIEGNIGAVARAMKNFGLKKLILVNPCNIGDETYKRAMHAADVLDDSITVQALDQALKDIDFIVGSSGISSKSDKKFLRDSITPKQLVEKMKNVKGNIAILFGREDYGLYNEELKKCDVVVTIPCSEEYLILNLSHAAVILFYELYELFQNEEMKRKRRKASGLEKEKLYEFFDILLDSIDYPEHKKEKTKVMFRRLLGRAVPSKWEFYTLMGVFSNAINNLKNESRKD